MERARRGSLASHPPFTCDHGSQPAYNHRGDDLRSPEKLEKLFPRDVFDGGVAELDEALWIDLPEEREDSFLQRGARPRASSRRWS